MISTKEKPMRLALAMAVLAVAASLSAVPAYASKDTVCEAYALASMRQIERATKYQCSFLSQARWQKNFNYHFDECAKRYSRDGAHRPFTQGEKTARANALQSCIIQKF